MNLQNNQLSLQKMKAIVDDIDKQKLEK